MTGIMARVLAAGPSVDVGPNKDGLPGISEAMKIVGALLTFGLIAAVAGIVLAAITWAVGSHSSNPAVAGRGKTGVIVSCVAALLVGGADILVNFFAGAARPSDPLVARTEVDDMDFSDFENLDGGLMFYALLSCLAALIIGAAWWALGHQAANPHTAGKGKAAVGAALVGALLVGGGPALVGFFTTVGSRIMTYNVDRSNGHLVQAQITLVVQTYCACAEQPAHVGEPIQVQYEVINSGQRPVASVRVRGDSGPAACPNHQLAAGSTVVCTATHLITAADLTAGHYTASGTATGTADDGTALSTSADAQSIRLRA